MGDSKQLVTDTIVKCRREIAHLLVRIIDTGQSAWISLSLVLIIAFWKMSGDQIYALAVRMINEISGMGMTGWVLLGLFLLSFTGLTKYRRTTDNAERERLKLQPGAPKLQFPEEEDANGVNRIDPDSPQHLLSPGE